MFLTKWISSFLHLFEGLGKTEKQAVEIGIKVTDAIKDFDTAHPEAADIITALIPGEIDDVIKTKLREALPKIAVGLRLVQSTEGLTDPNEILSAAAKFIATLDGDFKSAALHDFSVLVSRAASDGKLTWSDAIVIVESWFKKTHPVSS